MGKIVKDKIFNVHSYIECELVENFKGDCSKDSKVWNNIDDNPKDNVISGYTIPDMISDLERVSTIINKESFSERINHIVGELQQLKKTHDIELLKLIGGWTKMKTIDIVGENYCGNWDKTRTACTRVKKKIAI